MIRQSACGAAGRCFAVASYEGLWLSPAFIIHRMQTINETYGTLEARSSGRFKEEREAWTTALLALGFKEMGEPDSWVEIEMLENTPDTKLRRLDQSTGHNKIEILNIEVVAWEEHVDDAIQVIRQKCARAYPPDFGLVVMGRSGKFIDLNATVEAIRSIRVPFAEIWILGRPLDAHERVQMVRLFPKQDGYNF